MDPYYSKRPSARQRRNGAALISLVILGCGILFFAIVMIACSFVINFADDFETSDGSNVEEFVARGFTYNQYWAGIPFLVTGVLVIFTGTFQQNRGLSIATFLFAVICVALTLFIIALDGTNWSQWNRWNRHKIYWDDKDNVECVTSGEMCICTESPSNTRRLTIRAQCNDVSELSSLYGAVVSASIVVAVFCVFSIVVIAKSLSWKPMRHSRYRGVYYADDFHMGPTRAPSVIDMPYAKRGEYLEAAPPTGPPYKQTVYRNYPY